MQHRIRSEFYTHRFFEKKKKKIILNILLYIIFLREKKTCALSILIKILTHRKYR